MQYEISPSANLYAVPNMLTIETRLKLFVLVNYSV